MVCTVCFLFWWKILAQGIFFFSFLSLSILFLIIWIVVLGTHGLHYLFYFVMEISCSRHLLFWACPYILDHLDCFVRHTWFALSIFFCDGNFLLEAVGILSLSNYSWTIGLQIVLLPRHACLFSFVIETFCLRHLEIFLIYLNWIILLGTHGLHCLFSFMLENSCSRHLEFLACPNILDQLELDCFDWHAWFALSVFFRDGKLLIKAFGNFYFLSWWKILARGSLNFELI